MPTVTQAPLSGRYLSFAEREEIALLRATGCGVREIARQVGRSPSTISRELRRNAASRSGRLVYRASTAQWHADLRARRSKPAKLAINAALRRYVQDRLSGMVQRPDGRVVAGPEVRWVGRRHGRRKDRRWGKAWSPQQISHRLRLDFPDDESMRVSHEAIYQSLFIQVAQRSGHWSSAQAASPCCCTFRRWPGRGREYTTVLLWQDTAPRRSATRSPTRSSRCLSSYNAR
jgi:IS30 family transposase